VSKLPGDPGYAAGWCIHYRGITGPRGERVTSCEVGIDYEAWRGVGHDKQPCFLDDQGQSKPNAMSCPHLRRPTPEEIAAHKRWLDERWAKLGTVMVGIADWRAAHKGKSASEVVECPACKGRLHLSIAAYNGHVHGRCESEGCVSWME
jgi:hypothetical protein